MWNHKYINPYIVHIQCSLADEIPKKFSSGRTYDARCTVLTGSKSCMEARAGLGAVDLHNKQTCDRFCCFKTRLSRDFIIDHCTWEDPKKEEKTAEEPMTLATIESIISRTELVSMGTNMTKESGVLLKSAEVTKIILVSCRWN